MNSIHEIVYKAQTCGLLRDILYLRFCEKNLPRNDGVTEAMCLGSVPLARARARGVHRRFLHLVCAQGGLADYDILLDD